MENLFNKFKYIIIILLALIMIYIFSGQYSNIKKVVEDKYDTRQQLVEKNILQTVNYVNDAYKIVEQQLNQEMREYSEQMVEKYRENSEVMEWDLAELQQQFSGYNIYIIDQSLKIIRSTYKEDLGLDFSKFESFSSVLRNRMEGNEFKVDRIDLSTQTGEIKKYSYMPSPDHQYLFELSVSIEEQYPSFQSLNLFKDATALTSEYEMVEDISFYSVEPTNYEVAKIRNSKKPYINPDVPEFEEELARQAVINDKRQESTKNINQVQYHYRFFPALVSEVEEEQGWNSYVVGIVYNEQIMQNEISSHRRLFVINIVLLAALFVSFIAVVVYLLRKFEHQAYHDKLTGLANRKYFIKEFNKLTETSDFSDDNIGVVFIDIDRFKKINDNYGHDIGDRVLENIASRMKNNLKETDIIARMGGDEFVVALAELNSKTKIIKVVKRLIKELKKPLIIEGEEIAISVSAGVSFYPDDSQELEKLIKNADAAMYQAKKKNTDLDNSQS